jgi:hypothetical protein
MKSQPSLAIESSLQVEQCGSTRFLELGERHKIGEIYLMSAEDGTYYGCARRWLWEVGYMIMKAGTDTVSVTVPQEPKQAEMF